MKGIAMRHLFLLLLLSACAQDVNAPASSGDMQTSCAPALSCLTSCKTGDQACADKCRDQDASGQLGWFVNCGEQYCPQAFRASLFIDLSDSCLTTKHSDSFWCFCHVAECYAQVNKNDSCK